jgi:hypothetical protein
MQDLAQVPDDTQQVGLPADIDAINAAINGPRDLPLMPPPPDDTVTLARGVFRDGEWYTSARVRELTGEDEEAIARLNIRNTTTMWTDVVLSRAVLSVGPISVQSDPTVLDELIIGDDERLIFGIMLATYGEERKISGACPECQAKNDIVLELKKDFPLREIDDPQRLIRTMTLNRNGGELGYALLTRADQAAIMNAKNANVAEKDTLAIARAVRSLNGVTINTPMQFARELNILDRREILERLRTEQPGPSVGEVKVPCATCGVESSVPVDWADLL